MFWDRECGKLLECIQSDEEKASVLVECCGKILVNMDGKDQSLGLRNKIC